ncbi:winged helix-turn-helix domain-containing protein [Catellatospora vulcania]|uniref:winged helix-turn-helix domain-containing protein n=1 Tax=Catellatospora vulcania TaxID=1460450 RepID=UPI0012D44A11|nr:helix-turn-helix domain-containing protein [Catellatospora vulcania]
MTEKLPMRDITDPRMLRAMAHPVRLRLLNELALHGPATATALAERVGESAANCSWHLRQLAKFGFIEEAEGGVGRNRPWRWVPMGNRWGGPDEPPELMQAGRELNATLLAQELALHNQWDEQRQTDDTGWRHAAFSVQNVNWLTAEELTAMEDELLAVLTRYNQRVTDPAARPEGSRPVRMVAWANPHPS